MFFSWMYVIFPLLYRISDKISKIPGPAPARNLSIIRNDPSTTKIPSVFPKELTGPERILYGKKEYPAITCREMYSKISGFDGFYWINPSQGDIKNAIEVRCESEKRMTCIFPERMGYIPKDISSIKPNVWLGKTYPELKIAYTVNDTYQLSMLRKLSEFATQNIVYICLNSTAYYNSANKTYENSIKLLGWNNEEISPQSSAELQFTSDHDGCQDKGGKWASTKVTYSTKVTTRLPITDIAIRDIGGPNQGFYFQAGPVCFY